MIKLTNHIAKNKDQILVFTDQAIVSGSNFLCGIVLARYLGIESYGVFSLAWLVVIFISSIHQAFITMPLFTLGPKQNNWNKYLTNLHTIQIIFSAFMMVLVYLLMQALFLFDPAWRAIGIELWLPLASGLFTYNDFLRRVIFSKNKPMNAIVMDLIGYFGQIIGVFCLLALNQLSLTNFFLIINICLTSSIILGAFKFSGISIATDALKTTVKTHWNFSKYLLLTAILQWFSGNYLLMLGGGLIGPLAIGAIRMVQNLMGILNVIFLAMENIIPLKASNIINSDGRLAMLTYMKQVLKKAVIPMAAIAVLTSIFSNDIITTLYGKEYQEFSWVVIVFCMLYVLVFIGTLLRFVIRTLEDTKTIFKGYVVSSVCTLIIATPLINNFGLSGILIGLFLSQIICLGIYAQALKKDLIWMLK